jgi:hypothetical protein
LLDQLATTSRNLQQRMAALRTSALEPAALERFLDRLREAGLVARTGAARPLRAAARGHGLWRGRATGRLRRSLAGLNQTPGSGI